MFSKKGLSSQDTNDAPLEVPNTQMLHWIGSPDAHQINMFVSGRKMFPLFHASVDLARGCFTV